MKYQELFTPVKVGSITIKNRFAMAPMGPLGLADANGGWNQRGIDYYVERAKGGTGLIITGVTFFDQVVEKQDPSTVPNPLYKPVSFVKTSCEMTELFRRLPPLQFHTAGWIRPAARLAERRFRRLYGSSARRPTTPSGPVLTASRSTLFTRDT